MDLEQRIAQFQNMAEADPDNEMAHFSLGNALAQAGRHAEAAESFLRCVEVSPEMSKAYQLAAEQLAASKREDRAIEIATRGFTVAASKGDLMPRNAMKKLLQDLGASIPEVEGAEDQVSAAEGDDGFLCRQSGRKGHQLERPPFKGPVGQWIYENISAETWHLWIGQGTKVINELRLDLSRDEDSETYDRYMREFLGIDDALYEELTSGKATA